MLHIIRTYLDPHGQSYQREEFIRNNDSVIQAYIKIRQTKDDKFMWELFKYVFKFLGLYSSKSYYSLDENEREILKRERRRLQEQLRRVKRNEERYNQYEKQQILLQIQQQNLALIQSNQPSSSSSSPRNLIRSNSIISNLQLSMSEDDDDD